MTKLRSHVVSRLRGEEGVALVAAIIILFILLGIGTALIATATGQQKSGYNQQKSESAYSLAEAALNAQIYQLSLQWPTANDPPPGGVANYPTSCNAASNGTSYCPSTSDLSNYSSGSGTCPAGTQGDAWSGSSTVGNGWTTYVRDAGPTNSNTGQFFNSATERLSSTPAYDFGNSGTPNGYVWVRAAATVNCHTAVVVQRVSEQIVSLNFPSRVLSANNFAIENNGAHSGSPYLLNTQASDGQTSSIYLRCTDLGDNPTSPSSTCASYISGGNNGSSQIGPNSPSFLAGSSPTLTSSQVTALEHEANAIGTCYGGGSNTICTKLTGCPSGIPSGAVVYVEGPCSLVTGANGTSAVNSQTSPGILVVNNGTVDIKGGTFYGAIYMMNGQGCTPFNLLTTPCFAFKVNTTVVNSFVVQLEGNTNVTGGIDVDGEGGVLIGENSGGNLAFGDIQLGSLTNFGGAAGTPNTFRQLPLTQ